MENLDNNSNSAAENAGITTASRKPYKSPKLEVFGKLSRLTHGSGGGSADAGGRNGHSGKGKKRKGAR
jgi:hypothetical protein